MRQRREEGPGLPWPRSPASGVTFSGTMFKAGRTRSSNPRRIRPAARLAFFHGPPTSSTGHPDGLEDVIRLRAVRLGPAPGRRDSTVEGRGKHRGGALSSPGERYGAVSRINYLRCILCGPFVHRGCPKTRAPLTMTNGVRSSPTKPPPVVISPRSILMARASTRHGARAARTCSRAPPRRKVLPGKVTPGLGRAPPAEYARKRVPPEQAAQGSRETGRAARPEPEARDEASPCSAPAPPAVLGRPSLTHRRGGRETLSLFWGPLPSSGISVLGAPVRG